LLAVAVGVDGSPVSVSSNGDSKRDILVWMDHRSVVQAERISSQDLPVLQFYGGGLSPEMQAPKVTAFIFMHKILLTSLFTI
jgi:ribulose kinase